MALRAALLSSLIVAASVACDDDGEPETETPSARASEEAAADPTALFPLTAGDRWRVESGAAGTPHNRGVTALDTEGVAVMHGTGHALAERYRATDDGVSLVDPSGRVLVPLLRAPLVAGQTWEYRTTERDRTIECQAEVRDVSASAHVGGLRIADCVEVRRRCSYPAGGPFAEPTVHTSDETYCPDLGRVVVRDRFRPPPPTELMPADRTERVVGYRVAGAPRWPAPETFDCRSFILLPSDVQAACGTSVRPEEPAAGRSGDDRCTYRFSSPEGAIEVVAERRGESPSEAELDLALELPGEALAQTHDGARFAVAEGQVRFALAEGTVVARGRAADAACPEESAMRLVPLLRSLLR